MKMNIALFVATVLLVCSEGVHSSEFIEFGETAISAHTIQKRDIFQVTRNILNGLIDGLNKAVIDFNNAVIQFSNTSAVWKENVLRSIQNTTNQWLNEVETAVEIVLNGTATVVGAVTECLSNQQNNAIEIVNGTINGVLLCVTNVIDGVGDVLTGGGVLAISATNLAIVISGDVIGCGVANLLNFAEVGICLNKLVQKYTNPANKLIGDLVSFTTSLLYNVASIPTTFTTCLGSTAAIAALQIVNIVQQVPMCIIETVG